MTLFFHKGNLWHKKRKRSIDVVKSEVVEGVRERFGYSKSEMSDLMGFAKQGSYTLYLKRGVFPSFRFYAAMDAIELSVMTHAHNIVKELAEIKSGLKIE